MGRELGSTSDSMRRREIAVAPSIRSPCLKQWEEMQGNNRARYCTHCQLHVQNLSAMSRRDIAHTLSGAHDRQVCITYMRNSDGSMVTRAALLRERLRTLLFRGYASAIRALVPVALAWCRTPAKRNLVGTWRATKWPRSPMQADLATFRDDHSFVLVIPDNAGEMEASIRGSWGADDRCVYLWSRRKMQIWHIIEILPDTLRLRHHDRTMVYQRVVTGGTYFDPTL